MASAVPPERPPWLKPVIAGAALTLLLTWSGLLEQRAPWLHPSAPEAGSATSGTNPAPTVSGVTVPSTRSAPSEKPAGSTTPRSAVPRHPAEAEKLGGHYYLALPPGAFSWGQAASRCEGLGGGLAHISSARANSLLYGYIVSLGLKSAYFGYTDEQQEGVWRWTDGTTDGYSNWHEGEPNSENEAEDYAMFYWKYEDGSWNDGDFSADGTVGDSTAFLCEWAA